MNLQDSVRKGEQKPRFEAWPVGVSSAVEEASQLAAYAGLVLDPWQEHVLEKSLQEQADGRWSAFRVGLVVPRQNGKNAVLEARELAGALLFGESVITHTAHQFKTAKKSMLEMMKRIWNSPLIHEVEGYTGNETSFRDVAGFRTGNEPGISFKNKSLIQFFARSGDSGRGFTGDLIVLDEAYALKADEIDALVPTLAAKSMDGNPQIWITSSAGQVDSDYLASIRKAGIEKSSNRLAYFEWSVEDDTDPTDREAWYRANPGLGYRISEQYIQDEYEAMLQDDGSSTGFKRERLGIWEKLGGESAIPQTEWDNCYAKDASELEPIKVALAVDVPPDRASAVIGLAGELGDGRTFIEVIDRRDGTDWIPEALVKLQEALDPSAIVVDFGGAAGTLAQDLRSAGLRTLQIEYKNYGKACGRFFDLVIEGKIAHSNQTELQQAVSVSMVTPMGDSLWKWNRKTKTGDISPLVAVTLATYGLNKSVNKSTTRKALVM